MPKTLVSTVGVTHIWRSLKTASRSEAVRRGRVVAGDIERSFERITPLEIRVSDHSRAATALTLEDAFDRFLGDPSRSRAIKTAAHYAYLRVLTSALWGEGRALGSIGREDCRRLLEVLRRLPSNTAKRYPTLAIAAVLELVEEGKAGPPMAPATVNGYLAKLRAALNYAVNEGWIDRNPARGLRVVDPIRARDKRLPFSPVQLRSIFDAPLYRGCQDDQDGYAIVGTARPRRARYWIPLLALFAGLRMNEACQLECDDVQTLQGVPCLVITRRSTSGSPKRLKTAASERVVPIHPALREFGFLQFVEAIRSGGHRRLFYELATGSSGYVSDPFSKWFRRFLQRAGASAPRTCFHSFRHTFRDALREAAIRHEVALALGGWTGTDGDEAEAAYGRGFSPRVLEEAIRKITFPVDLSHLLAAVQSHRPIIRGGNHTPVPGNSRTGRK